MSRLSRLYRIEKFTEDKLSQEEEDKKALKDVGNMMAGTIAKLAIEEHGGVNRAAVSDAVSDIKELARYASKKHAISQAGASKGLENVVPIKFWGLNF